MTTKTARWSRRMKVVSAVCGCLLVAAGAYAATNWVVGLNSGSSGEGQSATISNLSITAVAAPAAGNLLFPGGSGDVVVTIANPNSFPVTITAVNLPANTVQAGGFTSNTLGTAQIGCSTTTSAVTWNFATGTSGTSHTLTTPLTVGASAAANNPLVVTLTSDALDGDDIAGGVRQLVLLHAVPDRHHGDRWRRHVDHEPGHRRLDQLVLLVAPERTERQRRGEPTHATWRSSRRCPAHHSSRPARLVRHGLGRGQLGRPRRHGELGRGTRWRVADNTDGDIGLRRPGQQQDRHGELGGDHACDDLRRVPVEHLGDGDLHAADERVDHVVDQHGAGHR